MLIWLSSLIDDHSYPKGLIVAFAVKRISGEGSEKQNGTHEPASDKTDAGRAGADLGSSDNATEETIQPSKEEIPRENVDNGNDSESDGKETKEGENSSENPVAEKEENGERRTAADYKDDMDVVLREDLKAVFQKFGTVKVSS